MEKLVEIEFRTGEKYIEAAGLQEEMTDIDESKIVSGSKFWAIDEAKIYAYESGTGEWYSQVDLGGGTQ